VPMAYGSTNNSIRNDLLATKNQASGARIAAGLAIINPANRPGVVSQLNTVYNENIDSFIFFEGNALVGPVQNRTDLANFLATNGPFQRADLNRDGVIDAEDWDLFFALWTGVPGPGGGIADVNNDGQLDVADEAEFLHQFRAFRFGADGYVGADEYQAVLDAFTAPGEVWPRHLFDLTGDGVVDCDDVRRLRKILTGPVPIEMNPDLNGDGLVNAQDIDLFTDLMLNADPAVDLDGNGIIDYFDLALYLNAVANNCP
jgi:hypothetical protein